MPVNPTDHEDEYFLRLEKEMKKKIAEQKRNMHQKRKARN